MFKRSFGPRKQRTRQHVIADQSIHHVVGFILDEGHTAQRVESDYGYDLMLFTHDRDGYAEPGLVRIQIKAAEKLQLVHSDYVYDVSIRDYNLWMLEEMPVIFILFDSSRKRAFWVAFQDYFRENTDRRPSKGAKTIRVRVPIRQTVSRRAISAMRKLKQVASLPTIRVDT
jgi:Domain of unknown function (DUF4365)